ncbi:MAG: T9SS type A sorting domain-containing protein [Saprospiraceae bacterium]
MNLNSKIINVSFILLVFSLYASLLPGQNILIFDDFESGDFAGKGWYDGFKDQRTTTEFKNGTHAYQGHFAQGATTSGAGRHLFTETDKVYISYWVKYSANWIGSGVAYHPHEWSFLTNEDWIYQGPADTYLTTYIEQNGGKPLLALQDSKNVDPNCILLNNNSFLGCNGNFSSYPFTEDRSACSCNGLAGHLDKRDCFPDAGSSHGYYSSRSWHADSVYFRNTPGPYYKNDWHKIEAYFELNNIVSGIGIPDGKIRYWYDGQLLITSDSILMRTGAHPDMKFNQLFYGPYIGVGSPIDQTWWVDDLIIADGIPLTATDNIADIRNGFTIFPNPSNGIITLKIENQNLMNDSQFQIIDVTGKILFTQKLNSAEETFHLNLDHGIYLIYIRNHKNSKAIRKLIIE